MVSRTKVLGYVTSLSARELAAALDEGPEFLSYSDDKGRNLLHLACSVNAKRKRGVEPKDAVEVIDLLLHRGLDIDAPAFCRGDWLATPLWHAVSKGENTAAVQALLNRGAKPDHCLWAAVFRDDAQVVKLLLDHGAEIDPLYEDGSTPLQVGIKGGHLKASEVLLKRGANVNHADPAGRTLLHHALKASDAAPAALLLRYDARTDIEDDSGNTAADVLRRKKSAAFRKLADKHLS